MNKNIYILLLLCIASTATAQQFQPLWLIDWAPQNKMFPLTTTVNGFDGVQVYAEFDTTVYGIIDTSRAYTDTWLKPELEAADVTISSDNNTLTLDQSGVIGLYSTDILAERYIVRNTGLSTSTTIEPNLVEVAAFLPFPPFGTYTTKVTANEIIGERLGEVRLNNYDLDITQDTTGLDGQVLTFNSSTKKIELQNNPDTWLKPEMESPSDVTITSNNTLRFESSPGGTDFITIQADVTPEIEVDNGISTADLLASSLTITNIGTSQFSTQGSNQFSVNHATSATNPAFSFFSDYEVGITGGETTGTEAPTIGIIGFDSTSTLAPNFQFNRGIWGGGFGSTQRVLSGYTLGEINFLGQRSTGVATPTGNTNSYLSAKIKVETTEDFSLSTGGSTMIFETSETGTTTKRKAFQIQNDQQLTANRYGSGNYTGAEAFSLGVTASGDIIEVTPSVPSNIYNTSDALTGDRTLTTNGRFLNFNIASGGTFYITDNFNNVDNNWTETGYYHNYTDGVGTSSTMVGGLTNSDPYFQHVADDPNQTTEIQNIIDPSLGEAGFLVETNIDGVNANDVNFYIGEFSDGTNDLTGLTLSNNSGLVPKLNGAYLHLRYETTDSTFRLFDDGLIFDNEQVPSITSGETSVIQWTGDGTKAGPEAIQVNHANQSGSTDASGDLTVTHNLGSSTFAVTATATGTTFYNVQIHTKTSTTFKIRFFDASGAAVASTAVTADWFAKTL